MASPAESRALWIYPWDLLDAGIEDTVRRAKDEWGLTALSLAASYHSAKFLLPRRSAERVFLANGAAVYFRPDDKAYGETTLRPVVTPQTDLLDVLDDAAVACRSAGLGLRAWTVGLHNSALGAVHPEASEENVFGDRYPWALCPANPGVRRYLVALIRDLATNHDLDAIDLESAGFHGLAHGHHHELVGINLGPVEEMLLGLCFCAHCQARADDNGVDADRLRHDTRALLERRFAEESFVAAVEPANTTGVASLLLSWADLAAFVRTRLSTVTELVAEIKRDALAGSRTTLALTAATFVKPTANAWLEGMDLRALGAVADELIVLGYAHDPATVAAETQVARDLVGDPAKLVVGLSLLHPLTTGSANLRAKIDAARAFGVAKFSFYNFGFVSEPRLGWLRDVADR